MVSGAIRFRSFRFVTGSETKSSCFYGFHDSQFSSFTSRKGLEFFGPEKIIWSLDPEGETMICLLDLANSWLNF